MAGGPGVSGARGWGGGILRLTEAKQKGTVHRSVPLVLLIICDLTKNSYLCFGLRNL